MVSLSIPSLSVGTLLLHKRRLSNVIGGSDDAQLAQRNAHSTTFFLLLLDTTPSRNPTFKPSFADPLILPLKITSSACRTPHNLGKRCVPPAPGIKPILTSGNPYLSVSSATRYCADNANSIPPPKHAPVKAAMIGFDDPSIICAKSLSVGIPPGSDVVTLPPSPPLLPPENSLISAPALNTPLPSGRPTKMMDLMDESFNAFCKDV